MKTILVVLGCLFAISLHAADPLPPRGNFNPGDDGPWNHRVLLATSPDGLAWRIEPGIVAERASVPELFEGPDGRPVLLFVDASGMARPGTLGALVRRDNGAWERRETNLRGADPNVVRLKDGAYRAYTKERDGAIVVFSSRDGLDWSAKGTALRDERYRQATDSDVFETKDGWVMLISLGPKLLRCTSADGLTFTAGEVMDLGGSVSDTVAVDGGWRNYFHVNGNFRTGEKMKIRSAFTTDGKTWKVDEGDRVTATREGPAQAGVGDAAPLRMKDGSWLMAVKSFIGEQGRPQQMTQNRPQNGGRPPPGGGGAPWERDVVVYRGGTNGVAERLATFERAGVPTVARMKDGRLIAAHQYFPENDRANFDKVALRFSSDEGKTWTTAAVMQLAGLPEGMRFPFDPTLVTLPDGRVRMYFTSLRGRQFDEALPAIHSAVSTDGVNYVYEPGVRFGVEGRTVIDCAVVLHRGVFHLFSPDNGAQLQRGERPGTERPEARPRMGVAYHATSSDGLNFKREADLQMDGRRQWLGNAQSDGERMIFFGTGAPGQGGGPGRGNLWTAASTDGKTWDFVNGPVVNGADSGAVRSNDGSWIVVTTGEQRDGRRKGRE